MLHFFLPLRIQCLPSRFQTVIPLTQHHVNCYSNYSSKTYYDYHHHSGLPRTELQKRNNVLNLPTTRTTPLNRVIRTYSANRNNYDDEGIFQRLRRRLGFAKTETKKYILRASGQFLFVKVADEVNYANFFQVCDMEDTFASWFVVMELHLWILSCRLMEEGEDGRIARNCMLRTMWRDVDVRSKKLEGALPSARKLQISEIGLQFNTQLISYDEGLLSSDHVLAGALWRRFLQHRPATNHDDLLKQILALELLLAFTRSQFAHLHGLSKADVLNRKFQWVPLNKSLLAV